MTKRIATSPLTAASKADPGPQAATLEEAVADVGKWLNERPSRPLDLRSVAMLVAAARQPREPLTDEQIAKVLGFGEYTVESTKATLTAVTRAIEQAHGITTGKGQPNGR